MQTSVYVHFPWCLKKCPYCDFNSYRTSEVAVPHEAYADAVLRELAHRAPELAGRTLYSVFFGGGTPSLWSAAALGRVLAGIRASFESASPELEVTVECNPTSLDGERARKLREVGVGRLSIGVQSLDDARLKYLGRLHDASLALSAIEQAMREVPRVSADLMFGMPGQRAEDFDAELERVLALGVDHVSAYSLTIEPGTQFGELHAKGKLRIAIDDDVADTFLRAEARCASRGLEHYEVSNYARPGQEARHNLHYWRGGDYVGLGAGAVGCLARPNGTARRWRNQALPERYLEDAGTPAVEVWQEALSTGDRVREALMLGLRTRDGVDLDEVRARTGLDLRAERGAAIERRRARGEIELDERRLRVPRRHWLALDAIVGDLF